MVDSIDKEKRSWVMAQVRGKDTQPEIFVRSLLHRNGFRFTVNGPKNKSLPGKPDIVLPKHKTIVFVHGCFWHGHQGCKHHRIPKSKTEWWKRKIESNRLRDQVIEAKLKTRGWKVIILWTCQIDTRAKRRALENKISSLIGADDRNGIQPHSFSEG